MERINQWFHHNTFLKLLSCVVAFIVWLVVANYSNPMVHGSITLPFDILNEDAVENSKQIYSLNKNTVTFSYNVRSKFKSQITPAGFSAYINLEDYGEKDTVPVYYEIDSEIASLITDVRIEPVEIRVTTEKIQQKKFAIRYNLIGSVPEGYVAGDVSLSPEYMYVKGPVSVMGKISGVEIDVDISGATEEVNGMSTVYFTDANGNALTGIEDSLSFAGDIGYSVPVYRTKMLAVNAFAGGAPASGYTVEGVETSPTFISVYGEEKDLDRHSYILIPGSELNISGATESKTFTIDLSEYLPAELKAVSSRSEITVYIKIRSIYDSGE